VSDVLLPKEDAGVVDTTSERLVESTGIWFLSLFFPKNDPILLLPSEKNRDFFLRGGPLMVDICQDSSIDCRQDDE